MLKRLTLIAVVGLVMSGVASGAPRIHWPGSRHKPKGVPRALAGRYPFREGDVLALVRLRRRDYDTQNLPALIRTCGISFAPTQKVMASLRQAGASPAVLSAISSAAEKQSPPAPAGGVLYSPPWKPGMKPIVTPISIPNPAYTEAARRAKVQGQLYLWVAIGADGKVKDVKEISRPLGSGLDENAISTVRTWAFVPPTENGSPVEAHVAVTTSFRLFR